MSRFYVSKYLDTFREEHGPVEAAQQAARQMYESPTPTL